MEVNLTCARAHTLAYCSMDAGEHVTFYNHETVGARITTRMLTGLGCDAAFTADVAVLVEISGRLHDFGDGTWTDTAVRRLAVDAGDLVADTLAVARADCTSARPGRRAQVVAQVNKVGAVSPRSPPQTPARSARR